MQQSDSEFSVIQRYFSVQRCQRGDVALGIGDDCALVDVPAGKTLAVSLDLLVENTHFFADTDPERLGHKSLAVNLSDLAAQGAEPAWVTLGLSLASVNESWLKSFCDGFFALAGRFGVQLIGGDTTRGPLTIAVQVHGFVDKNTALRRSGARPGDAIFVTGCLGDAALALNLLSDSQTRIPDISNATLEYLRSRLERPTPRVEQGLELAGKASAAIDISDGFAQDLGHILSASQVGASVWVDDLPLSNELISCLDWEHAIAIALSGGDDYELCFTVPPSAVDLLQQKIPAWDCRCSQVGVIEAEPGLRLFSADGSLFNIEKTGYDHFKA